MRLFFILGQTFKGLRHNKTMTMAVTLVTFVSLLFVGAAALLQLQISYLKDQWYDKVEVSAFICSANSASKTCPQTVSDKQIEDIRDYLESSEMKSLVSEVYFESQGEAIKRFQTEMKDVAWVQTLTAEQLPASYRVKLVDPHKYEEVAQKLSVQPGVEIVVDQRKQLEPLFNVINRITWISAGIAAIMILTALLLVPTTIRLSAMTRQRETGIMRLVGASSVFIATPFILEGVVAALIGSGIAVVGLGLGVKYLIIDWLGGSLSLVKLVSLGDVLWISPFIIGGAVILAALASTITIKRYLKV